MVAYWFQFVPQIFEASSVVMTLQGFSLLFFHCGHLGAHALLLTQSDEKGTGKLCNTKSFHTTVFSAKCRNIPHILGETCWTNDIFFVLCLKFACQKEPPK